MSVQLFLKEIYPFTESHPNSYYSRVGDGKGAGLGIKEEIGIELGIDEGKDKELFQILNKHDMVIIGMSTLAKNFVVIKVKCKY